jgi:dolichol-phosphate mannosyltransferase
VASCHKVVEKMSSPERILVALATYNELENLPSLLEEIWRVCPQVDVLVVDDNSPDGTGQWCEAKAAHEPRLKVTHRLGKLGIGSAHLQAMRYADRGQLSLFDHDGCRPQSSAAIPARIIGGDATG